MKNFLRISIYLTSLVSFSSYGTSEVSEIEGGGVVAGAGAGPGAGREIHGEDKEKRFLKFLEEKEGFTIAQFSYDEYVPSIIWQQGSIISTESSSDSASDSASEISPEDPRLERDFKEKVFKETLRSVNSEGEKVLIIGRPNWQGTLAEAVHDKELQNAKRFYLDPHSHDLSQNNFIRGIVPISEDLNLALRQKFDFVVIDWGTLHHIMPGDLLDADVRPRNYLWSIFSLLKSGGKLFIPLERGDYKMIKQLLELKNFLKTKEPKLRDRMKELLRDLSTFPPHITIISPPDESKALSHVPSTIKEEKKSDYIKRTYENFFPLLPPFRPFMAIIDGKNWEWLTLTKAPA